MKNLNILINCGINLNIFSIHILQMNKISQDNKMTFFEEFNVKKVEYLFSQNIYDLTKYNDVCGDKTEIIKLGNKLKSIFEDLLVNAMKSDNTGIIERKYFKKSHREYVKGHGIQQLPKVHRDFIMNEGMYDYDMKNAHPKLLYYLCKTNDLPCSKLKMYVNDREQILEDANITKTEFLTFMNRDKLPPVSSTDSFIRLILEEIQKNKKRLVEIYKNIISLDHTSFDDDKPKKEQGKNPISSKMCNILMYYENKLLQKIIEKYPTSCSVPMYDGFISREELDIEELNKITEEYDIEWCIKPFESPYTYDDEYEVPCIYEIEKKKFEKDYYYITSQDCYITKIHNGDFITMTQTAIRNQFENIRIRHANAPKNGDGTTNFFNVWLKDTKRQSYLSQDFIPYNDIKETPENVFNRFDGFKSERTEYIEDDIAWFDNYLNNVYKNEEIRNYIKKYLAHIVQKPNENSKVAMVLKGVEGSGKDTLVDIISSLIGSKYVTRGKGMDDLFGNYNSIVSDKMVCCMNEVQGKDGLKYLEDLKEFVTSETMQIREKFVSSRTKKQIMRLFILSNNYAPVNVSPTDRRFLILETNMNMCSGEYGEWWSTLHNDFIGNDDVMNKLYSYLMDYDISNFNPKNDKPQTDTQNYLATRNISAPFLWIYKYIEMYKQDEMNEPFYMKQSELNRKSILVSKLVLDRQIEIRKSDIRKSMDKHNCIFQRKNKLIDGMPHMCWIGGTNQEVIDHFKKFDFKMYDENALDWNNLFENTEYTHD